MSRVCVVVCVVRSHVEVVRRSECTVSRIVGFAVLREFSVCSRGEMRMQTATWWYRDQRLQETSAAQPCVRHWFPDAPLSCWVAQLARRQLTSNVELASRAFVMSWRGVRGGRCLDRPALYLWRWCSDTVCAQSYKHTVCVICSAIRRVLLVRGTDGIVPWRLQVKAVIGCVFVLWLDYTVLRHCGFNLVSLLSVSRMHG